MKKYLVELTVAQREELSHMISTGRAAARELTHARMRLESRVIGPEGPAWSDAQIQEALDISASTLALHRPQIGYCLSLIPLHRLDQGTQIGGEAFGFVRGERLRHGLFQRGIQGIA